ncbi:MAG: hypothetical protein SGPRY_014173, partial [Prymnesium sp.]
PASLRQSLAQARDTGRMSFGSRANILLPKLPHGHGDDVPHSNGALPPNSRTAPAVGCRLRATRVSWFDRRLRRRRPLLFVPVRPRGRGWRELEALFEALSEVTNDARGVTLAPARRFPSVLSQGILLVVSDASRADRDDGVGGFAAVAALPDVCLVVNAVWLPIRQDVSRFGGLAEGSARRRPAPACVALGCYEPSPAEAAAMASLRDGADMRLNTAHGSASGEASHLNIAHRWLERFIRVFPSRRLFVPHSGAGGGVHATAYNEETFRLFAKFIRRHGSVRRGHEGEVVTASATSEYVSATGAFRSREAGYKLLLMSGGNIRLPLQMRHMRKEDGSACRRQLSRALTGRSLRRLLQKREFATANSRRHSLRWAVLWGGHNLLLIGSEFGCPDHKRFDPKIGLTIADFDWIAPCFETDWFYAVIVDVLPIKDELVTLDRPPVLILL